MNVLIVVAHPDDEVLGCGGTAWRYVQAGIPVRACILCGKAGARRHRPGDEDLLADTLRASRILGLGEPILGDFPNIRLNMVPHLELVQFIEAAIRASGADTLFTHHPGDLNNDHNHVSLACQAASRLPMRVKDLPPMKALYYMELLSATDWSLEPRTGAFHADTFVHIGADGLERKLEALRAYRDVLRPFPHSRSEEVIRSLAICRGAQSHVAFGEAFQCAMRVMETGSLLPGSQAS